ncbi:MAG: hypothetical protein ACKOBH_06735 [bacterium]
MRRLLATASIALAVATLVALSGSITPKASAGGTPTWPCYNCKFGFNWLDSDSTSGVLQVGKRCRANRRLALYGTPNVSSSGLISRLDRTRSTRRGNWELTWTAPRTILVIKLVPEVVKGTVCKGASVAFVMAPA